MIMTSSGMHNTMVRLDSPRIHRSGFIFNSPDTTYATFSIKKNFLQFMKEPQQKLFFMENVAYLESIHQYYFSSSFDAFGIFELIVTIASGVISGFSLSVVMFKLNCSKGSAGVYPCLLETTLIPDIYTMVRSSFGPNELSFVAVKTCRCLDQLQVYILAKYKSVFLFTFNLLS